MKDAITQEAVTQYELLCPLLSGIYGELQELSKKKPDTPLNNFKVKSINRVFILMTVYRAIQRHASRAA